MTGCRGEPPWPEAGEVALPEPELSEADWQALVAAQLAAAPLDWPEPPVDGPVDGENVAPVEVAAGSNLHPLDRHQNQNLTWTSPTGRTYTVDPFDYRLGP